MINYHFAQVITSLAPKIFRFIKRKHQPRASIHYTDQSKKQNKMENFPFIKEPDE